MAAVKYETTKDLLKKQIKDLRLQRQKIDEEIRQKEISVEYIDLVNKKEEEKIK